METWPAFRAKASRPNSECNPGARRLKHSWNYVVLNTWAIEITAIAFSIVCLATIVTVLSVFDNHPAPQLRYGLTLNAIVAAIAAAAKSSLICAIAGSIGQLKWCSFTSRSRKLQDLQMFDDASRGPLGAMSLLSSFSWCRLASAASLITVLAITFDPFVQQVLSFPVLYTHHGKQGKALARWASTFAVDPDSKDFIDAINSALWNPADIFQRDPLCPSGNCTWPQYYSLAWCSKCQDVTHTAKVVMDKCDFDRYWSGSGDDSLLCDLAFDNGDPMTFVRGAKGPERGEIKFTAQASWTLFNHSKLVGLHPQNPFPNKTFLGVPSPFLALGSVTMNTTLLGAKFPRSTVLAAEECVLSPCMRNYKVATKNGIPSVDVVSEDYGVTAVKAFNDGEYKLFEACWESSSDNVLKNTHSINSTDTMDNAFCGLQKWSQPIGDLLSTSIWTTTEWAMSANYSAMQGRSTNMGSTKFGITNVGSANSGSMRQLQYSNFSNVVGSVAASLTRLTLDQNGQGLILGLTITPQIYVHVEWAWLILPVVLEAAGVAVLALTILVNRRERVQGLWKSSLLPLLYHGLHEQLIDDGIGTDVAEMDAKAEKMVVRLVTSQKTNHVLLAET